VTGQDPPHAGGAAAFAAATGDTPPPAPGPGGRAAEVRVAFEGLLQIRRLANSGPGDPGAVPAQWELLRPARAVALALEAAGIAPSAVDEAGHRTAVGYVVRDGERPGTVRVVWAGPRGSGAAQDEERALSRCAAALAPLGWEALLYRGERGRRHLEVESAGR
jgi:hypothetical protein